MNIKKSTVQVEHYQCETCHFTHNSFGAVKKCDLCNKAEICESCNFDPRDFLHEDERVFLMILFSLDKYEFCEGCRNKIVEKIKEYKEDFKKWIKQEI